MLTINAKLKQTLFEILKEEDSYIEIPMNISKIKIRL